MKRDYLKEIEIVGAVLVYQEGEQCRWSLDWLYANCDRVCIVLDNWNKETECVIMEYRDRYPEITHIAYSDEPIAERTNRVQGQIKRRFKKKQAEIREIVVKELKKMHDEKPIDILIWPDSDETFINEFPRYLEEFWNNQPGHDFMMLGFVEVYDNLQTLMYQRMAPHGRVYKYKPELTVYPWKGRTRYHPYFSEKRPWKVRNMVVHVCHLTEEYRNKRQYFDNVDFKERCERRLWFLEKNVRKMTVEEIAEYQPGPHQTPSKYPPIPLDEYMDNKEKYNKQYNIKPWTPNDGYK